MASGLNGAFSKCAYIPTEFIYQAMQTPLPIYCNPNSAETVGASLSSISVSRANVRSRSISIDGH